MTNKKQHAAAPIQALLGRKIGMTQVWDADGRLVPLTVVQVGTNVVTQVRTEEVDGYSAIQLGFGEIDSRKVTKPLQGHFEKAGVAPRRHLVEVRTSEHDSYEVGQELDATTFEPGRIFKGLRMAGRMGGNRRTVENLTIQAVDTEKGLLLISGAIPGPKNGVVLVRSSVKGA